MIKFLVFSLFFSCSSLHKKAKTIFNKPTKKSSVFRLSWNKNLDPEYDIGNLPIGGITPKIHNDKIYVGNLSGGMHVFDLNGRDSGSFSEDPILGRPLIKDNIMYYGTSEGHLVSKDLSSGKILFKEFLQSPIESDITSINNQILIRLRSHVLVSVDEKTGKILWHYKRSVPQLSTLNRVSTPLIHNGNIIFGTADGYIVSLKSSDGGLNWERKLTKKRKFIDIDMKPLLIEGKIWIGSLAGNFHILEPSSGATLKEYKYLASAEPVLKDSAVYLFTDSGEVLVLNAKDGSLLKKKKISSESFGSSKFWKSHLVASTYRGKLYAIDPSSLEVVEEFNFGHKFSSIFGHLESNDDLLAAYSSRNRLYVFK